MTAYLVDTNVLLRVAKPDDRDYPLVRSAMYRLWTTGHDLRYTSQNLAEFWNACTRPVERNGYGLSIPEVGNLGTFTLFPIRLRQPALAHYSR